MGVRYYNIKRASLKQLAVNTSSITWISPAAGPLGSFAGGQETTIPVNVRVINGPAPVFTLTAGQLPPGMTFDPATGAISGTPDNTNGTYDFTLHAASGESSVDRSFQIEVEADASPVWTTPAGSIGTPFDSTNYDFNLEAVDPEGETVAYSLVTGSLPGGLTLNPNTGNISGLLDYVSEDTLFSFTVRASDGFTYTDETFDIMVKANAVPYWVTATEDDITVVEGVPNEYQFEAVDPEGSDLTFSITDGTLPTGIILTESGMLSGTLDNVDGDSNQSITILVSDGLKSAERTFNIAIKDSAPPAPPLLGWSFNRAVGDMTTTTAAPDIGEAVITPTLVGVPVFEAYGSKSVAAFDRTESIRFNTGSHFAFLVEDFTFETWIKSTSMSSPSGNESLLSITAGTPTAFRVFNFTQGTGYTNKFTVQYASTTITHPSIIPADGSWHHVAVAKSGNTMTIYLDGVGTSATVATPATTFFNNRSSAINGWPTGTGWSPPASYSGFKFYDFTKYTGNFSPPVM